MTKEGKTTDDIADYSQDKQLSLQPLHEWNILKKERTRQISFLNWSGNYVSPKKNELTSWDLPSFANRAHFF